MSRERKPVDPTKCYICGESKVDECKRCHRPICAAHMMELAGFFREDAVSYCERCHERHMEEAAY